MGDLHRMILSLGSNIEAEINLPKAVQMLRVAGNVEAISSVWESESVGFNGPNFLNACVAILSPLGHVEFKEQIIRPIESNLGRVRSSEKNAPRPIDIDVELCDGKPVNAEYWRFAFVLIPLAELIPEFPHPASGEPLAKAAEKLRGQVWMRKREDVSL
jgi:2-amino-4-hydroxy-6-hydroxymethyldihydropteridine diphosphokinase